MIKDAQVRKLRQLLGEGHPLYRAALKVDSTSVSSPRRARILWNSLRPLGRLMDVARALFQIAPVSCD